jgi:hypothetical protein
MAKGKRFDAWDRTSLLAAAIHNSFRGPGDKPLAAADFNPFLADREKPSRPKIKDPKRLAERFGIA